MCLEEGSSELTGSRSRHRVRHQLRTSGFHEEYVSCTNYMRRKYGLMADMVGLGDEFKNDPRNPYAKKAAH